jgi:transitional endoplasmic reticulum ATPase
MTICEDDIRSAAPKSRFRPIELPSHLAIEGAVLALRMIQGQRWQHRLMNQGDIRDDDVLTLIGLELDDHQSGKLTSADLREAFSTQLKRLERRVGRKSDVLDRNIRKLGTLLKLTVAEQAVLRVAVVTTRAKDFGDLFHLAVTTPWDLLRAVRDATGFHLKSVGAALASNRTLRRSGFLQSPDLQCFRSNPLELDDAIVSALLANRFDEARFLRHLIRTAPPATLALADFSHLPDLDVVQRYLRDAFARRRRGVNILLYGIPGTGKTEFVRTLASALQLTLHEVPNEDSDGDPISGRRRFSAYTVCQHLLTHRRRQMLLFDEVEDVFGAGSMRGSIFALFGVSRGRDPDELRKSWVNETLESNPVPAIWVCNSIGGIDGAFLRRFDLVMEFRTPGPAIRRRMIDRYFRSGEISEACAQRLAGIESLPPAHIARAARVARTLRTRDLSARDAEVERVVVSSLRAMGYTQPIAAPALPDHYDPAFLNTDRDLDAIAEGLRRQPNARFCLYGPPGTGKTAFAHHLGGLLSRPVLVKRGSDLLDKYVGGTEASIAAAFEQARDEGAILVIDEADGFLRDRAGAHQRWEVTQVNELLTQMEAFDGLFIASTNLVEMLDAASLRRFDFKVKFDYLTRDQRRAMLLRIATDATDDDHQRAIAQIDRLSYLTPGDFANALRQLRVIGEAPTAMRLVELLASEVAIKPEARRRSIGFVAA